MTFVEGDVADLPFEDGSFDLAAACAAAPRHTSELVVAQLTRVIGFSGQVLIVDQIAPIDPLAGFELDRFERARDPSHTRLLPDADVSAPTRSTRTASCSAVPSSSREARDVDGYLDLAKCTAAPAGSGRLRSPSLRRTTPPRSVGTSRPASRCPHEPMRRAPSSQSSPSSSAPTMQRDQLVTVSATLGEEEMAREVAAAAYRHGARFVDVTYFDPYVKRARIEHAREETLDFVPSWYGDRMLELGRQRAARISLSVPLLDALDGVDPERAGRDQLPFIKQVLTVVNERLVNWTVVPSPTPRWARLVYPGSPRQMPWSGSGARSGRSAASTSRIPWQRGRRGRSWKTTRGGWPLPGSTRSISKGGARISSSASSRRGMADGTRGDGGRHRAHGQHAQRGGVDDARSSGRASSRSFNRSRWATGPSCAGWWCGSRAAELSRSRRTRARRSCGEPGRRSTEGST